MKIARSKNAKRNILVGLLNKLFVLGLPFAVRTVFIYTLGSEYLGLNSLFTSILSVLNVTELGLSSAIVYCMYAPIANDDYESICALLNFYKRAYRIIGIIILTVGLSITPFVPKLIKGDCPSELNLYILYLLYLINTVLSYLLFAYKKSILDATQRRDVIDINNLITVASTNLLQLIVLLSWKDPKSYYLYLGIMIIFTIINNILNAQSVKKLYPMYSAQGSIEIQTKRVIKKQVSGLLITRICQLTRSSFDSIFISAFLGLTMTTIYGNYHLIVATLNGIMNVLTSGIIAGVGNSIVSEDEDKNYRDFTRINFLYMLISSWTTIAVFVLIQNFMTIWVGEKLVLDTVGAILFSLYYYTLKMGDIRAMYSDAVGLWWENRRRAVIEMIMNIVLNYILVIYFGINGIVMATIIPIVFVNFIGGAYILFKHYFKSKKITKYFIDNIYYFIVTIIIGWIAWMLSNNVGEHSVMSLILRFLISVAIPLFLFALFYGFTENGKDSFMWIKVKMHK